MNAVEIEKALSELIAQPFDAETFPWEFLRAFGNKETTIKRLMTGDTNKSDVDGVLQRHNIHIKALEEASDAAVSDAFQALRDSEQTARQKARFVLATDGQYAEFLDRHSDTYRVCSYADLAAHFADFLPLAGIETVAQIRDHALDIRATNRLNKLYVQILQDNPAWNADDKADAMNHFMARLIFCYFAEDTQIFGGESAFSQTVGTMTQTDGSNVAEVLQTLFDVMDCPQTERDARNFPSWANDFPYVNGNLFSDPLPIPTFSRTSRAYLTELGGLDWSKINPDIFGSMIQAVADPEERSEAGMHYTSVPNILKVLNPLFLNDLREQLNAAGDNARKLLNLRKRIARIRVFDPACGSGNFLVIAYKQLREIEAEINRRRGETALASGVKLTNFRGIEIRNFAVEIARLALIIAQYQCDVLYRGQQAALKEFLPLQKDHWIVQGNALRLDWKSICPPTGTSAAIIDTEYDLFNTPLDQPAFAFENEGGETYIVGNPPYVGSTYQNKSQKDDLKHVFEGKVKSYKSLDYVAAWVLLATEYGAADVALVTTNSICQGQQVARLWPYIFETGMEIHFAVRSFKWANLAAHNAGVTVIVVGLSKNAPTRRTLYDVETDGTLIAKHVENINAYLVDGPSLTITTRSQPFHTLSPMDYGNKPTDGGHLFLTPQDAQLLAASIEMHNGGGGLIHRRNTSAFYDESMAQENSFVAKSGIACGFAMKIENARNAFLR